MVFVENDKLYPLLFGCYKRLGELIGDRKPLKMVEENNLLFNFGRCIESIRLLTN
jgi:hypothetical protein